MLVPDWPAPPTVRALCSTRAGGVSVGAYESLNLGAHVGDRAEAVAENRARLQQALGAQPLFLEQVHGTGLIEIGAGMTEGRQADACSTVQPRIACTVMVADCLPVLLCDAGGTRVAAAHAGWRGLAAGVLERACEAFRPPAPTGRAQDAIKTIAWLGPCIGPRVFEVGGEVKAAFEAHSADAARCFRPAATEGKWLADLAALARQRLHAVGIEQVYGNDGSEAWCTVANPSRFFSHRRDGGVSGRFAACVWLV
jgi:YfiH family protein